MVFNSGITNGGGMPTITANRGSFPTLGLPFQLYLDTLTNILYFDRENSWQTVKANPATPLTFSNGLTLDEDTNNVTNDLSTGSTEGSQNVVGGNVIDPGAYLNLRANAGIGTGSFLNFYSIAPGTRFFQDTGNWNFGGSTDTGFLANFASEVNFEGDITCNNVFANNGAIADFSAFKISGTGGSGVLQMIRNSVTPTQIANETVFFADATGKLSWFNSNGSYQRTFDATGITAARTWTLPDATTTIAGLAVANVFTQPQIFPLGSSSATSINGGTAGTGIYFPDSTSVSISISSTNRMIINTSGINVPSTNGFVITSRAQISSTASNNILLSNSGITDFGLLQFGGTTSSFPALKRSTTKLQARLADDSAFANIQGKLQTDTNYTAGVQVTTGYITIYDAAGTAYKVSCNV